MNVDDHKLWTDFLGHLERDIASLRAQLKPLEDGSMHTGEKSEKTGFVWVDTSENDAQRLRDSIASVETVVTDVRRRLGKSG